MSKRRAEPDNSDCCVCLEPLCDWNRAFPFGCGHDICTSCDFELFQRADDRCPMCRSQRTRESVAAHTSRCRAQKPDTLQQREAAQTARSEASVMFFPIDPPLEIQYTMFRPVQPLETPNTLPAGRSGAAQATQTRRLRTRLPSRMLVAVVLRSHLGGNQANGSLSDQRDEVVRQ